MKNGKCKEYDNESRLEFEGEYIKGKNGIVRQKNIITMVK